MAGEKKKNSSLRHKTDRSSREQMLTIRELAFHISVSPRLIERLVSLELVEPVSSDPEPYFSTDILPKVERLMRLHHQLGVNWSSMGLVLELLERMEEFENRIRELERG